MEMLPIEVISAAGKKELGIDPLDIESALIVAEPPVAGPPGLGIVLQMRDKSATLTMEPPPPYLFAEGGIIIAASTEALGEKIKASREAKIREAKIVPLAETLQRAAKLDFAATLDVAQLRPLVQAAIAQAPPLPPPLEPLKQTPELVSRIELDVRDRGSYRRHHVRREQQRRCGSAGNAGDRGAHGRSHHVSAAAECRDEERRPG